MEEDPPPQPLCASKRRPREKLGAHRPSRPIEQPHVPCAPRAGEAVPAEEDGMSRDARI